MSYFTNSQDREVGRYKVSISPVEGLPVAVSGTHPAEEDLVYKLTKIAHDALDSHGYSAATQEAILIFQVTLPDGLIQLREITGEEPIPGDFLRDHAIPNKDGYVSRTVRYSSFYNE